MINILCILNANGKVIGTRRANGPAIIGHLFALVRFIGEHDLFDQVSLTMCPPAGSKTYKAGRVDVRAIWNALKAN